MRLVDLDEAQKRELAKQLSAMGLTELFDETLAAMLGESSPNELIHLLNSFYLAGIQKGENQYKQAIDSILHKNKGG